MNNNETRNLWISLAIGLFSVFLIYSYTQEKSAEITKKFGLKKRVVIATKHINAMETINETMLKIVERPLDFIEPGALNNPDHAIGLVALTPIQANEQILKNKIIEPGPVTGLSLQVAPNKRAITLPVDKVRGVAKLIKPGDRIDLLAALDVGQGRTQKKEVKTILQDVIILATGLRVTNELPRLYEKVGGDEYIKNISNDTNFDTITVEVSPKEAQGLVYILSTSPGSLFMTLRHPSDHVKFRIPTTLINNVLGISKVRIKPVKRQRAPARVPQFKKPKPKPKTGGFINL
ncbi:MAG: Flp pilus assembly protein CpaB [Bdellovibrionaceae bacterium]|nr:Flp pilus assembly protein CpaB [Pseudobdellovibrionaceae bacterium]